LKILLLGRNGQVGWELERSLAPLGQLTALGRADLELRDAARIREVVRAASPDVIVNAAAYTAVDKAESERDVAFAVNATAPGVLAEEAKRRGALLVHYSTDYVFDGTKATPYVEDDAPNPLNVYGASKLAGESAIAASGCRHLILRTSWVYSHRGSNFLLSMLRLARGRPELRVVKDQIGTPTSSCMIARATAAAIATARRSPELGGLFHLTARGETSWYGFAQAIFAHAGIGVRIVPIKASEYPSTTRRPAYSVLDCAKFAASFNIELENWKVGMLDTMARVRTTDG
jgi:dTDP-4-dehydrorhamnose reductase